LTDFQIINAVNLKGSNSEVLLKKVAEMKVLIDSVNPILS
jgi:hypothetical protein